MAPAHSFDENTCKALKKVGITHITDGIAVYPFKKYGLYRLPQQLWKPQKMPFGTRTICLHPNSMKKKDIQRIEEFCSQRKDSFVKPS
jgi:hypothetical protein